ncbi:hypothetical protein EBR03_00890 [bacterium]|nr:hypothetical protein [bacterium]
MRSKSALEKVKELIKNLEEADYVVNGYPVPKPIVEAILTMPKKGRQLSYAEARAKQTAPCIKGFQLDTEPLEESIVEWAQRNGYYIEFEEGELEF